LVKALDIFARLLQQTFNLPAFALFYFLRPSIDSLATLLTQVSALTALAARQAVPPLTGYDSVVVYRSGSHRIGSGFRYQLSAFSLALDLRLRNVTTRIGCVAPAEQANGADGRI
jgi:hypothetical protein